jgi:hypothetical protein
MLTRRRDWEERETEFGQTARRSRSLDNTLIIYIAGDNGNSGGGPSREPLASRCLRLGRASLALDWPARRFGDGYEGMGVG